MSYFCNENKIRPFFEGKTVAIVGSGPGSLDNQRGYIDSFDTVVRVNNYKIFPRTGFRTDVFYSYFGGAVKKTSHELLSNGTKLCIAKCPNAKFIESEWHSRNGKEIGVDFRYIYQKRENWWFCDTYVPSLEEFLKTFNLLGEHIPTTGFSAILKVLEYNPKTVYLTGFDFFESKIHNVDQHWKVINTDDPICHRPDLEKEWLIKNIDNFPFKFDDKLNLSLEKER